MTENPIVVIGGGASGMMAALTAKEKTQNVTLIEPNEKLGRKLYITGKGRCNLTNDCTPEVVLNHIPRNSRFLYSAVSRFPPASVKDFFSNQLGVPLKTERGGRVFPVSDRAADVIDALFFALKRSRVLIMQTRATRIVTKDGAVVGVETARGEILPCSVVILATGGLSYPTTGATGDGYQFAADLGHTIIEPKASLVPLVEKGNVCAKMQGLSLRNVLLTIQTSKKKLVFQEQGELLFTHFGLSGPLVLSASAHMQDTREQYRAIIDMKPALDEQKLEQRILRDFSEKPNMAFHNVLEGFLPRLMIPVVIERCGIDKNTPINAITKAQRRSLLETMKRFELELQGTRPIAEAIITAGGIKTSEVNPTTLMSKKINGLFFAGEILDVDAYTGGFNLQIAWCTGRIAGEAAAEFGRSEANVQHRD